nr:MAG TPA: hypothetical protein [Caudoviricetes sp.]
MKTINDGRHTYREVKKIPAGYKVWNIPSIGEGCVPLYISLGGFNVDAESLKYIKMSKEEAAVLHAAAHSGIRTLADAKRAINSQRKGPISEQRKNRAIPALSIFEKYTK